MNPISLCKVFGDKDLLLILVATYIKPRDASELSKIISVSKPVTYKKIEILEKLGLIKKHKSVLTSKGKRIALYKSNVKKLHLMLEGSKLKANTDLFLEPGNENIVYLENDFIES